MTGLKVLLADDHPLFRDGIKSLLRARGIEVIGEASDGLEALEQTRRLRPDLVLMDINMPRCDGLEATRRLKAEFPDVKVVMLTVYDSDQKLFEAIKSGADGYLLKSLKSDEFFQLLTGISQGEAPLTRAIASRMLRELARVSQDKAIAKEVKLSEREIGVVQLVAKGATNKEIAATLGITENTVKYHLKNMLTKLHLQNRAQAAAYAVREGLGDQETPPKPR
ncbi:MAG: response regulator transcription factor [Chloroflexi bacterium]|nr:response regulator transcription factor [Chloroflexota bacterium]